MYLKLGDRIVNTDAIVEAKVTPAREGRQLSDEEAAEYDYPRNNYLPPRELRIDVVTTATTSEFNDGGDYPQYKHTEYHPYTITLRGADAEHLLEVLPVYDPEDAPVL